MVQITYTLRLDMRDTGIVDTSLRLKQGDSGMKIAVNVFNGGVSAFDSSTTPKIVFRRPDGASVMADMTVEASSYSYTLVGNELQVPGKELIDIKFPIGAEGRESTMSCSIEVVPDTITPNTHGSDIYDNDLAELVAEATAAAETVEEVVGDSEAWAVGERNGVPVGPEDPAYHNNSKYWSEQANPTRLENLTDVDFDNPTDGDILRYNSGSSKWENSDDLSAAENAIAQNASDISDLDANKMSYAVNTKLGAHNLLPNNAASKTESGITYTVNATTKVVTTSGTMSNTANVTYLQLTNLMELPAGRYRLTGCPSGGSISTYNQLVNIFDSNNTYLGGVFDTGNGVEFDVQSGYKISVYTARFDTTMRGQSCAGTWYPMITLAEDTDPTYSPYTMTNKELTDAVNNPTLQTCTLNSTNTKGGSLKLIKLGKFACITGWIWANTTATGNIELATLPITINSDNAYISDFDFFEDGGTCHRGYIDSNTKVMMSQGITNEKYYRCCGIVIFK